MYACTCVCVRACVCTLWVFLHAGDKWLTNKDFVSLSATANQWCPCQVGTPRFKRGIARLFHTSLRPPFEYAPKVVPPAELAQYLEVMRAQGYTIVGAEQTVNSVGLDSYTFPAKTVRLAIELIGFLHLDHGIIFHKERVVLITGFQLFVKRDVIYLGERHFKIRRLRFQLTFNFNRKENGDTQILDLYVFLAVNMLIFQRDFCEKPPLNCSVATLCRQVIVLGAERTGIPADVLCEVDQCVEIPQFGTSLPVSLRLSGGGCKIGAHACMEASHNPGHCSEVI